MPPVAAPQGFAASVAAVLDRGAADAAGPVAPVAMPAPLGPRIVRAAPWVAGLAAAALLAVMLGPWAQRGGGAGDASSDVRETADLPETEGIERPSRDAALLGEARARLRKKVEERAPEAELVRPAPAESAAVAPTPTSKERTRDELRHGDEDREATADTAGDRRGAAEGGGRTFDSSKGAAAAAVPVARRYVVFEDEAAARRFLARLRPPPKDAPRQVPPTSRDARPPPEDAAASRGDDVSRGGPAPAGTGGAGPATGSAGAGGPSGGTRTGGAAAQRLFAEAGAPRVLGRVTVLTTDGLVGRALTRAPAGGTFGEAVDPALLTAAEARFEQSAAGRRTSRRSVSGRAASGGGGGVRVQGAGAKAGAAKSEPGAGASQEPAPGADAAGADAADTGIGGGAGGRGSAVPKKPAAPAVPGASAAGSGNVGAMRRAAGGAARVEIVVVLVPQGTLPPRPPSEDAR